MRESDPWLEYWYGRAWIFVRPPRGRPALERAYEAFRAASDLRGQALALNTIVTGYYYEWANFVPLDRWLPEFDRLLGPENALLLDRESELRARAAHVIVLLFRRPEDPLLAVSARRLDELIDGEGDLNARMMAASTLFNYLNWTTKGDSADGLVARIEPIVSAPEVTPLMQVWWRTHLSFWHHVNGRYDQSAAVIAEAREIAERYGLAAYLFEIDHAVASALISKGDYAAAAELLQAMERRLSPARRMDWAYFHHLQANLEQRLGHFGNAAKAADAGGRPRARDGPAVGAVAAFPRPSRAQPDHGGRSRRRNAGHGRGDRRGVRRRPQDVRAAARARADRRGPRRRRDGARRRTPRRRAGGLPRPADKSCSCAIARTWPRASPTSRSCTGSRPSSCATLIERNLLAAPADAAPAWPFRLRIMALGGFELVRDGVPMRFTGKAQQRPLDLLKLLVALGGSDVDSQQLTSALWPDADGDAAKTSFDTTLFRLRKLIDVDNALVLSAGKLSLARTARVGRRVGAARRVRGGGPPGRVPRARTRRRRAPPAACSTRIPVRCWAPRSTRGSRSRATPCARASCARWRRSASASSASATSRPPSTSTGAVSRPTISPSRSIAASCARWPRPARRPRRSTRSGAAANCCRSCWA